MKLEIVEIQNRGVYEEERVILKVLRNTDLSYHFLLHTKYTDGGEKIIINPVLHTKWFASKTLKANDLVVLYSKSGTYSSKVNDDGSTSHFYYWDLPEAIYKTPDDCVVGLELDTWYTSKRG